MDLSNTAGNNEKKNSQAVQWLGPQLFTAQGPGSIPSQEIKIPQAMQCGKINK